MLTAWHWREAVLSLKQEFERETPRTGKGDLFAELDRLALAFLGTRSRESAKDAKKCLLIWRRKVLFKHERFKPGILQRLENELDRLLNDRAIAALRDEAKLILRAYGADMPSNYSQSLTEIFISPDPPVQNFLWHQDGAEFNKRFQMLIAGRAQFHQAFGFGTANAFVAPLARRCEEYPNIKDVTLPPVNRVMELSPDFKNGTVRHELLHWCTHEAYEQADSGSTEVDSKVIIEGVTEYLTRKLKDDPQRLGSYNDECAWVGEMIAARRFTEDDLRKAYFGGQNAPNVQQWIKSFAAQKRAAIAALPKEPEWSTVANLAFLMRANKPADRLPDTYKKFLKTLTDAQVDMLKVKASATDGMVAKIKNWITRGAP